MLLVKWDKVGRKVYLARQTPDFKFNRLDKNGDDHMWGRKWLQLSCYQTGPNQWTQIGPLTMVQWSSEQ